MSGDGSNGRSRYEIQTTNGSGPRMRPWPIGRHHKPAIIDYHTAALDDMVAAVKLSAEKIRSPELITQIARNPRGVWNPPVLVLARAYIRQERFFWLDASLRETGRENLQEVLDTAGGALQALSASGDHRGSRAFHVDGASIGFAPRCFVGSEAPADADASELGPLRVHVVVTGDYLLTLHEEQVSLPALLAPDLPSVAAADTSCTRSSTRCSRAPSMRWRRSS